MINANRKTFIVVFLLSFALFISGCASPYVLSRKQKTLNLKDNEGVVLFSTKIVNLEKPKQKYPYGILSLNFQEINQYKGFKQKPIIMVSRVGENYEKQDDLFLFSFKFPEGTYRLAYIQGIIRVFFGGEFALNCNKLFDVKRGEISYLGRMNLDLIKGKKGYFNTILIKDKSGEDKGRFRNAFLTFYGKDITTDLFY